MWSIFLLYVDHFSIITVDHFWVDIYTKTGEYTLATEISKGNLLLMNEDSTVSRIIIYKIKFNFKPMLLIYILLEIIFVRTFEKAP